MFRLKSKMGIVLFAVPVVIAILLLPPYFSWLKYEPDTYVVSVPRPDWDYPFDMGFEWSIAWDTLISQDVDGGVTTRDPATGRQTTDLRVSYSAFDLNTIWRPSDTELVTPPKPSLWDYVIAYYSLGEESLTLYEDAELCIIRLTCDFISASGDMRYDVDLAPDDLYTKDRVVEVSEYGSYSDSFTLYTRIYSGTYTFRLLVLENPPLFNGTVGWDTVIVTVVNPYEN